MNESEASPNMENKCPQCGAPLPSGVLAGLCPACLFKQGAAADTAVPPETAPFQPPSVEEVAKLFPQLEIIAFIGKGGMGAVYKARQPALDRIVALKILPPLTAGGSSFVERFNREARALAKLNHPNIVAVYEFGQVNGLPFFIMEFVDGLNLRQLERAGKLSPREAVQIVPQICEALQFAHDEGIVHRDIKPENILLDKKGRVKIADFGIAKILGREPEVAITETGGSIGTPHYMAPEQMEKPTTVDHRADIFSLGVVFYEMLTGELPLGKFAPPSSRKIEVDVRLDDVVLRALERDPELRYQHASQVKTAVDTISSTAAPPPPINNAASIAQQILAQDYTLDIGSCLRRGWKLLRANFWPFVGVTALFTALMAFASSVGGASLRHGPFGHDSGEISSAITILIWGPLTGGLSLYFLRKIRGEKATVETVFSGFSSRFLHLFLVGFVSGLLIWIGFLCLILPGIYLTIAWMYCVPLVIDKNLDFWSAMELSRKVVTRHWWKFLGFTIVSAVLIFAGAMALGFGVLVTLPWVLAALNYAYEDIFGSIKPSNAAPPIGTGPFGTSVVPPVPSATSHSGGGNWATVTKVGLAAVAVAVIALFMLIIVAHNQHRKMAQAEQQRPFARPQPDAAFEPVEAPDNATHLVFGPVIERDLQSRATGTNQFLDLDTQQLLTPSGEITNALTASEPVDNESRFWEALDIPENSHRFQYISWLRESGADLMFAGDGKIVGFDGIFAVAHGDSSTNWDDWEGMSPEQARAAVETVDWGRRAEKAQAHGEPMPPAPKSGGIFNSAMQLTSQNPGGPLVNLLTRDQSVTWFFKTREGALGVLQLVNFTNDPPSVKIRYKLVQQTNGQDTIPVPLNNVSRETLDARLQAASMITDMDSRNRSVTAITIDAAKAGQFNIVKESLQRINDFSVRNDTALEAVRLLAQRGLKKEALEIAKGINDMDTRDQALSELAK